MGKPTLERFLKAMEAWIRANVMMQRRVTGNLFNEDFLATLTIGWS
jgi:hypothetical protein